MNSFKKLSAVIACLLSMACAATPKPDVIIGDAGINANAGEGDHYRDFELAYWASYCQMLGDADTVRVPVTVNRSNGHRLQQQLDGNVTCADLRIFGAYATPEAANQALLNAGFTLARLQCHEYFRRIGNNAQDTRFASGATNILSGATVAFLEFGENSAETIAQTSLVFSTLLSGMKLFDEVYQFGPDLNNVQEMVETAQTTYANEILNRQHINHYEARLALLEFQSICQVPRIRSFINEAVGSAEFSASTQTERDAFNNRILDASVERLLTAINTEDGFNLAGLDSYGAGLLVTLYSGRANTAAAMAYLDTRLAEIGLDDAVTVNGEEVEANSDLRTPVRSWYNSLASPSRRILDAITDEILQNSSGDRNALVAPDSDSERLAVSEIVDAQVENRGVPRLRLVDN